MGTTVSAPVYGRSVSPPLFLGVVAIDVYMDALEQLLGEDTASSSMLKRFVLLSTARCPRIELTECELDALRFLGGGEQGTCGLCSSSSYAGIIPEQCPFQSDLPNNLWHNTDSKRAPARCTLNAFLLKPAHFCFRLLLRSGRNVVRRPGML